MKKFRLKRTTCGPPKASRTRDRSSIGERNGGKNLGTDALHVLQRFS